jgi:hypothetical protein
VKLIFEDFKVKFETGLVLDKNGYLDFELKSCLIDFGNSYLYHDNVIVEFIMHEILYLGIVVIENSVYYLGDYVLSSMMGPILDEYLNHYSIDFGYPSLVKGQY